MKKKPFVASLVLFAVLGLRLHADSPLTSTNISSAYGDFHAVIEASEANGWLTESLMEFIADDDYRLDVRIAVINELSWDINGKNNFDLMVGYLFENGYYSDEMDLLTNASGELLICLAYILALDNYFDVADAAAMAAFAMEKNPHSYTVSIIWALIEAQIAFDHDWCLVYTLVDQVRWDLSLEIDMEVEAIFNIFEYMDIYAEYCH